MLQRIISEIDELAIKTEVLERQQQELKEDYRRRKAKQAVVLSCMGVYLVAFAIIMLINQIAWEVDWLRNVLPGVTLPVMVLCMATAVAIFVCLRSNKKSKEEVGGQ